MNTNMKIINHTEDKKLENKKKRVIKITAAAGLAFLLLLSLGAISSAEEASGEDEFRVIGYYSADLFDEPAPALKNDFMVDGHLVSEEQLYYKGICKDCLAKDKEKTKQRYS